MTVKTKGYSVEQVIEVVEMLANSQGFMDDYCEIFAKCKSSNRTSLKNSKN